MRRGNSCSIAFYRFHSDEKLNLRYLRVYTCLSQPPSGITLWEAPQATGPIGCCCRWRQEKHQRVFWTVKLFGGQRAALPTSVKRSPQKLEITVAAFWQVVWFACSVKRAGELPQVQSHSDSQPPPHKVSYVQRTELVWFFFTEIFIVL